MQDLYRRLKFFLQDKNGQALVEYALILILVAIVVLVMLTGVGKNVSNMYYKINNGINPGS